MKSEYVTSDEYTRGGGPAFPVLDTYGNALYGGMTLRDYFAAAALAQLADVASCTNAMIADQCYQLADELLKARNA